jgi:sec-independent protein translocase protein TatA
MIEGLLQPQHLLIILAVALFVFGPKKLPELGKGLGQGIKQFREGMKQATADVTAPSAPPKEADKPHA